MIIKKTSSEWISENPILPSGDIGYETDTYRFKIGNGITNWAAVGSVDALRYATVVQTTSAVLASENLIIAKDVVVLETDTGRFKIGDGSNDWNNLPYEEIVTASRLNNLQSRIDLVLGNGTGNRGYGQGEGYGDPVSSYQVNTDNTVLADDINAIYADMIRSRIHQIGTEPTEIQELVANLNVIADDDSIFITDEGNVVSDTQGNLKGLKDFEDLMNTIDTERFLAHPSQMSLETKLTSTRTALWNGVVFHEFDVAFQNDNHRRHFFNSGGQIRISSKNTSAQEDKGKDWTNILSNAGEIIFDYASTTSTGSGTGSNIGNYDLTSNYQVVYQKIGQGTIDQAYTGNTYKTYAKIKDNKTISFKIEYDDVVTTTSPTPSVRDTKTFSNWAGTEIHQFTYVFQDAGSREQFFNLGNTIRFRAFNDYVGGTDQRTLNWKTILQEANIINFGNTDTSSSNSAGFNTNIGNEDLNDRFQLVYRQISNLYSEVNYSIYARNSSVSDIEFRIEFNNDFDFSATRTCIAVIDESQGSQSGDPDNIRNDWLEFRSKWPDRPFHILWPNIENNGSTNSSSTAVDQLRIPTEYINDPLAYNPITVKRDEGVVGQESDWFDLLGLDALPYGSNVALFIDTSGSMGDDTVKASLNLFRTRLQERGMDYIEVFDGDERWSRPFISIPDGGGSSGTAPPVIIGNTTSRIETIGSTGFDSNVDGRLETEIKEYRAVGNAVEVASPLYTTTTDLGSFTEPAPIYNLIADRSTVAEGESFTIILNTYNVPNGTPVPYVITGISAGDISQGSLTGTFVVQNNTASIVFTPIIDGVLEPTERFTLSLQSGSTVFASVSVDITNTALPTYALSSDKAQVEEGESFVITLDTTQIPNGELVPYTITGISTTDIAQPLRGSFIVNGNTATKTFTAIDDNLFEGYGGSTGANLIVNGSFEIPGVTSGKLSKYTGSILGWTTADPNDDIEPHLFRNGLFPSDGSVWLDLEASPGNIRIGQDVQGIQAGSSYRLSFDIANSYTNAGNTVTVWWNGQKIYDSLTPGSAWETYSTVVLGNSGNQTNRLEFEGNGPEDNIGVSLDNVLMYEVVQLTGLGDTGDETFKLTLDNQEDDVEVIIKDKQKITYNLSANFSEITEGDIVTITLNTTFLQDGVIVPYTITGVGASDIDVPLTGNFTVTNNTATLNIQALIDSNASEGDETLVLSLVNGADSVTVTLKELILPTSAERTCIAVIDEASIGGYDPSRNTLSASWADFRTKWPDRPFYLLQPNIERDGSRKYTNTAIQVLRVPDNYLNDPLANNPVEVNRDDGRASRVSDWYDICNLDSLPDGSKIALFIDTSGSMRESTIQSSLALFRQRLQARNMEIIEVYNRLENWIEPFDTILD